MSLMEYIIGGVIILFSLLLIAVILLQEGKQSNMSAISGGADNFMDRGRGRTMDAFLAKWTKVLVIVFFVLVFVGMLVTKFFGPVDPTTLV